jgi:hypothetical protein
MTQYLLSIYQPGTAPPPPEILDPIMARIGEWRDDLRAAGGWVFTAGLFPPDTATVLRPQPGGSVLTTDGPFAEGKEHVGGFTVIRAADLDEALAWGRRLAEITGLPIEVRPAADLERD